MVGIIGVQKVALNSFSNPNLQIVDSVFVANFVLTKSANGIIIYF